MMVDTPGMKTRWCVVWRDFRSGRVRSHIFDYCQREGDVDIWFGMVGPDGPWRTVMDETQGAYLMKQSFSYLDTDGYGSMREESNDD
jgi:hypothetical protein